MSRGFNPWPVWSQVPVANRLVEVNTKTGFSLTAGSYAVRASSSQRANATFSTSATVDVTIASVTTTRATAIAMGSSRGTDSYAGSQDEARGAVSAATTVTFTRTGSTRTDVAYATEVLEIF